MGSGRLGQRAKLRSRRVMYEVFEAAFDAVGVGMEQVHLEDRGDGVLAALAPHVPPSALVGLWLEEVYQGVREHNAGLHGPLRLRIAMHGGPVAHDGRGLVGRAVDLTCRLCDSDPARGILAADDTVDVVFVVSDALYRSVVVDGGRFVESAHYRPYAVQMKETDEVAWFHVPGREQPPVPGGTPVPTQRGPAGARRATQAGAGARAGAGAGATARADAGTPWSTKYAITVNGHNQIVDGAEVHGNVIGVHGTDDAPDAEADADPAKGGRDE